VQGTTKDDVPWFLGKDAAAANLSTPLAQFLAGPNFSERYRELNGAVHKAIGTGGISGQTLVNQWAANPHGLKKSLGQDVRNSVSSFLADPAKHRMLLDGAVELVKKESVPLRAFSVDEIRSAAESIAPGSQVDAQLFLCSGFPAECSPHLDPGSIWQAASQFNGLESCRHGIADLQRYTTDHTQGPGIVLGSDLLALAMRHVANRHKDYPDAIRDMLNACTIDGTSVLSLYPAIYDGYGWFEPQQITNNDHLRQLAEQIEKHIGKLKILLQWCLPADGHEQLMVLSAAPCLSKAVWKSATRKGYLDRISRAILRAEYGACGHIQKITRKTMHYTAVGMGAFANNREIMDDMLAAAVENAKGSAAKVVLHGYSGGEWNDAIAANGYAVQEIANGFAECRKKHIAVSAL
jgi:hypothetical protein